MQSLSVFKTTLVIFLYVLVFWYMSLLFHDIFQVYFAWEKGYFVSGQMSESREEILLQIIGGSK
jgi:hypothetical protein